VALLSGRNFETRDYEEEIAEASFERLKKGVFNFMSKTHFDRLTMILRSAGFVTSNLIRSKNAVNFAYIIYLRGRAENMDAAELERLVRRWYVPCVRHEFRKNIRPSSGRVHRGPSRRAGQPVGKRLRDQSERGSRSALSKLPFRRPSKKPAFHCR
jgi:hypothetical protein